jgi:hypothetical protein
MEMVFMLGILQILIQESITELSQRLGIIEMEEYNDWDNTWLPHSAQNTACDPFLHIFFSKMILLKNDKGIIILDLHLIKWDEQFDY